MPYALGGLSFIFISFRSKLHRGKDLDLAPSNHWPEPVVHEPVANDSGPLMILITYKTSEKDRQAFINAAHEMKIIRKRSGAFDWGICEDTEHKNHFVERFMEESWVAHLRHHERVTKADRPLQASVLNFHKGSEPPKVQHLLACHQKMEKRDEIR